MEKVLSEFEKFLKHSRKKNGDKILPSSINAYKYLLSKHIDKLEQYKNDEDLLLNYINRVLRLTNYRVLYATFRTYLKFIGYNETNDIFHKIYKPQPKANYITSQRYLQSKVLSIQEVKRLLMESDLKEKVIISFLFDTACRRSELLNVKWRDIQFYKIPKNNIFGEVKLLGKGQKSRVVFITKTTTQLLKEYKKVTKHNKDEDFVIRYYEDKEETKPYKYQQDVLYKKIRKLGKKILDRDLHPHMFRHSKSQQLANDGADMLGISNYLGHANASTTQVYIKNSNVIGRKTFEEHSKDILGDN